jgi:hypothetical protein
MNTLLFTSGFAAGLCFAYLCIVAGLAFGRKYSKEAKDQVNRTCELLEAANYERDRTSTALCRIAEQLEINAAKEQP